jgi:hypothetical protein
VKRRSFGRETLDAILDDLDDGESSSIIGLGMDGEVAVQRFEEALGTNVGTGDQRRHCAETLRLRLVQAIVLGFRESRSADLLPELANTAGKALRAVSNWRSATWTSYGLALHHVAHKRIRVDLDRTVDYLALCVMLAARAAKGTPQKKRGKQNILAVTIVRELAVVYSQHLGRRPTAGHRGKNDDRTDQSKRHTPFQRVCGVAQDILSDLGYAVTLSDSAIHSGLRLARPRVDDALRKRGD